GRAAVAPTGTRPGSNRGVRHAFPDSQRIGGGLVEADVFWQHDRGRAHGVGRGIDAVGLPALLGGERRLAQPDARHDHAVVGGDQVFLAAVLDRTHAFLDGGVLHGDAGDATIAPVA